MAIPYNCDGDTRQMKWQYQIIMMAMPDNGDGNADKEDGDIIRK